MPDRSELETLLTENLEWVDRVAMSHARRSGLDQHEAVEFRDWVRERLVDGDYAILRKFRGESAIRTYLTVVIGSLLRDYRATRWGRWRPSAAAKRLGPLGIRLETLVYRDNLGLDAAARQMRAEGFQGTDRDLRDLLAQLRRHAMPRPQQVGDDQLESMSGDLRADDLVEAEEAEGEREAALAALASAMAELSGEDRTILRLWMEGTSVADIARELSIEQKPLYRRLERIFGQLRKQLIAVGVTAEQVRRMTNEDRPAGTG
jgi:RNA polymerase sigma factor for flagellar operon FliA